VVLRSLGKFFGLAGVRLGFIAAWPRLLTQMRETLGPWTVNGPARWIARHALRDTQWQDATCQRLLHDSARLAELLSRYSLTPTGASALFQSLHTPRAQAVHEQLARSGILVRVFSDTSSLRFGLPGASAWNRLNAALASLDV
jgi:cobalamin biosynthetic protein CobC